MDLVRHLLDKGSKLLGETGFKFFIVNESKRIYFVINNVKNIIRTGFNGLKDNICKFFWQITLREIN